MLEEFFDYVGQRQGTNYLHWNMHDINHSFAAVEHRFRVLGGQPVIIDNRNKFDLARLLIDTYGTCYIGHPRLEKLMPRNSKLAPHFLTGEKEAKAFKDRNYVRLRQSTLRKVELLASFATWAQHRSLKTDTTWWQMHGGRVRLTIEWVACHWLLSVLSVLITIIGGLYVIVHRMV